MAKSKASDDFDVDLFETRLEALKDTQEGIQQMSSWCLQHRAQHKKIVSSWLNVLKRVRIEHRLVLFYLANDVIQYSKRKHYDYVESWATALQKATTMVRDEKVKNKILRIFSIWEQREIYNEEFLTDLCGLLNISPPKKAHATIIDSDDFQNAALIASVRECVELSETTDKSFKKLPKQPACDIEAIKQQLKDRSHSDDVEKEIERYVTYIEAFNKNLQCEIKTRRAVLSNLDTAVKFYANQRGEVKVVVSAYKNFGNRIKLVKKKLDEITPTLPSPIPSPDINAPSPEPDADLPLPDDQSPISMNFFKNSFNGYSSYLDGNLPFDINDFKRDDSDKPSSQPIEVIGSRSDDESYNPSADFYKPESISAYPGTGNMSIPGLAPMPVPAVPSGGYTSLARSSHQYGDVIQPPPNPPHFGGNGVGNNGVNPHGNSMHHANYSSVLSQSAYNSDNTYNPSIYNQVGAPLNASAIQPLMPPPPMPPTMSALDTSSVGGSGDFNSTWDMSMSWTNPMDTSNASNQSYEASQHENTHTPPHYEKERLNSNSSQNLDYSELEEELAATQDVDHRQLHLPVFGINCKIGISKEKSRQLDIDHRNLISLTGSPGNNDIDIRKASSEAAWYDATSQTSGDIDYRTFGQTIKTIDTSASLPSFINDTSSISSTETCGNLSSNETSPQKNSSPSKDSQKEDASSNAATPTTPTEKPITAVPGILASGYDPADMVVDMDMSDEDLDDIFREVTEQAQAEKQAAKLAEEAAKNNDAAANGEMEENIELPREPKPPRAPLLETPPEYDMSNSWENLNQQMTPEDWEQQMPHAVAAMAWAHANNRGGAHVPPPPRPPFNMTPFNNGNCGEMMPGINPFSGNPIQGNMPMTRGFIGGGGPGRSRGWVPQNHFRGGGFRPPRPYFPRGGAAGGRGGPGGGPIGNMRGGFRGKFRGKNNWI